ncbi:hypothetical protein GCM10011506_22890 [Marivirga lumbricoides]|uniref:HTH araC/xylS-type domain-containing protein n=1 Tax=Marivirga lumbricoides TaxID=1046115 RepID=A0ABQ1MCT7_9BACT|nr:hypothetical protein GCM10011506_22890 [Marivirga lumbricoides]
MDFGLTYGPLAYLHILHIKNPQRKFSFKDFLHFLPSLLFDGLLYTAVFLYISENIDWAYANISLIQTFALYGSLLSLIQFSIYTYLIYRESKETKFVLRDYAEVRKWLSALVISWIFVIGFLMVVIIISLIFVDQLDDNSAWVYNSLGIVISLWIFVMGYLYLLKYAERINKYMIKVSKFKFSISALIHKKNQLLDALTRNEFYKDQTLTVAKFAGHLGWPINTVSSLINETLETSFSDLINQYRIAAFKEECVKQENRKYSILGLGQAVGFSSKTSFYRIFKNETGMTPSEYLKLQSN